MNIKTLVFCFLTAVFCLLSAGTYNPGHKTYSTKEFVRNYQRKMPNKPNSPIVQLQLTHLSIDIYEIYACLTNVKNKANSNPNKPNIKTIWALSKPIQSQIKANNQSSFSRPNLLSIFNRPSFSVLTFCSGVLNPAFSLTSYLINDKIYIINNTG
jgi:hypothetical protein